MQRSLPGRRCADFGAGAVWLAVAARIGVGGDAMFRPAFDFCIPAAGNSVESLIFWDLLCCIAACYSLPKWPPMHSRY